MPAVLELEALSAGYGHGEAVRGVSLRARPGDLVLVFGRNGSGRSTLLRALIGLARTHGRASLDGTVLTDRTPSQIAHLGVGYAPDTRDVFPTLSVVENLAVVAPRAGWCDPAGLIARFAPLLTRRDTLAGRLSGGEQKLLAIARAALGASRLLLLDEPYEGLAETMCVAVDALIEQARQAGVIVLITDRDPRRLGARATHWLLLGAGEVRYDGPPATASAFPALAEWSESWSEE